MKHPNKYGGKNPIPAPARFGSLVQDAAPVVEVPDVANDDMPTPAATAQAAAKAACAISSIDAKSAAPNADPNVTVKAGAAVDPLSKVPSGAQILADTSLKAASKRPAS
jgi:hypothetical protein